MLQLCLTLCDPRGLEPTRLVCPWVSQARSGSGFPCWNGLPFPSPQGIPIQGLNPRLFLLLCWQAGSSPLLAPPGKPFKCTLMLNFFRCSMGKPKTPPSFLDLTTTGKSCTFCQTLDCDPGFLRVPACCFYYDSADFLAVSIAFDCHAP